MIIMSLSKETNYFDEKFVLFHTIWTYIAFFFHLKIELIFIGVNLELFYLFSNDNTEWRHVINFIQQFTSHVSSMLMQLLWNIFQLIMSTHLMKFHLINLSIEKREIFLFYFLVKFPDEMKLIERACKITMSKEIIIT